MASIPLPSYLTKADIKALMEACIKFYAVELLGEGYRGYLVTSWQIPHLGFKWKSSLGFFKDISQITSQDNIKKAYNVLAGWEKEAPDVLSVPTETQEVSETVPRNLDELVEALEKAKSQEEKSALIRNYQAFKAAAPVAEAAAAEGVGIKITPEALKFFEQSLAKTTEAPFKLATFFSSPKFLSKTPQAKRALASSVSLSKIAKRAESLPEPERRRLLELVENLRQAEFSFFAQTKLSRRIFSVQEITILMGPEVGLSQGKVAALVQGGAPPGKKPSLLGRLFGGIARRAITKTATKAVTSALTKAGVSITTKTVAAGIGTALGGPIGTALGLAVGWVIDKVLRPLINKITDFISQNKWVLAIPFVAAGLILGLPWLTVVGLAMGGLLQAGGVGPALSGAATGVSGVLTGVLSLTVASIATPLIIALISIPLIVAIILFIINSGAYVVPPSGFSLVEENPYIGVLKEVSPSGPFENSNLPLTVTYTITVTAKRGTLTNIVFDHKCEAMAERSTSDCPAPLPDTVPETISPVEPYVFTYTQTYSGSKYQDSLVINTFTVTANTPEVQGTTAIGAASLIIGNPPTGCYNVAGNWPTNDHASIMSAISNLVGNYPSFVTRLCATYSQVNLYYDPPKVCGAWGCAPGGNVIYFNSGGLGSLRNATYILAHESGHVLAYGSPSLYQSYLVFPGTLGELPVCSYGGSAPAEGFAEAISHYAVSSSCLSGNPNNIKFVETMIFR